MKNKSFPYNDEINISDIIRRLYKEKFLILFFTIIFGIIFSLLPNFSESKKNKIIFVLKDKTDLFQEYTIYLGFNYDTENNFNNQFQSELLKFENMNDFLKRDKDFEKFQKYFKQINTTSRKYFMETFGQATHQNKNIYNQFFFSKVMYTPLLFLKIIYIL
jgi:LPS O-antigen subunit length determinant protein (WzzB/FepE family)